MGSFQAPVGGIVSPVNDVFYEGGQFMPDTGLYCGAVKRAKKHAATGGFWSDLVVRPLLGGWWVERKAVGERWFRGLEKKPFVSKGEAVAYAEAVLESRAAHNRSRNLQPHPTLLVVS